MTLVYRNLRRNLSEAEDLFLDRFARHVGAFGIPVRSLRVARRSIDARAGRPVTFVYHLAFEADDEGALRAKLGSAVERYAEEDDVAPPPGGERLRGPLVVVGTGPAGLYAASILARAGFAPRIVEKGLGLRERVQAVRRFFSERVLAEEGNFLFGEGGAGTYSDGKLLTRVNRPGIHAFYRMLVACGAPPSIILTDSHPHVGTDRLRLVAVRLHRMLEEAGCTFRFRCALSALRVEGGRLAAARLGGAWEPVGALVLAAGQNDDDVYRLVRAAGGEIEPRPYQLGVRIEHAQAWVDRWRYGRAAGCGELSPASYQVTARGAAGESTVTSFCMCPGGEVVPVSVRTGLLGTNGMSRFARSKPFANSALITTLAPRPSVDDQLAFREELEAAAFRLGGGDFGAPAQRAGDFLRDRVSGRLPPTSYRLGVRSAGLRGLLPREIADRLAAALTFFERLAPGFAGEDALLIGPESRVSAPVRILRDEGGEAPGIGGLYPCGEGSGYASGITSSALDGRTAAFAIIRRYAPAD